MLAVLLVLALALSQATTSELQFVEANPADVATIDAVVTAYYESLSGEPGDRRAQKARYASLFVKSAGVVTPTLLDAQGRSVPIVRRIDDWMTRYPDRRERSFYEWEVARRTERYGHMAHVYSTYEIRDQKTDPRPVQHGVTSFDLAYIDGRWWIVGLQWSGTPASEPLPPEYAPRRGGPSGAPMSKR
jgi:hypothetical protein